jgi:starch phosphorylase
VKNSSLWSNDKALGNDFLTAKRNAKLQFADWLKRTTGETVDPDSIFDCHIKRIHEYKRQLLNALRIVVLYNRLRENPKSRDAAAYFLFFPSRPRLPINSPRSS